MMMVLMFSIRRLFLSSIISKPKGERTFSRLAFCSGLGSFSRVTSPSLTPFAANPSLSNSFCTTRIQRLHTMFSIMRVAIIFEGLALLQGKQREADFGLDGLHNVLLVMLSRIGFYKRR